MYISVMINTLKSSDTSVFKRLKKNIFIFTFLYLLEIGIFWKTYSNNTIHNPSLTSSVLVKSM